MFYINNLYASLVGRACVCVHVFIIKICCAHVCIMCVLCACVCVCGGVYVYHHGQCAYEKDGYLLSVF